jgi:hypothetical protein
VKRWTAGRARSRANGHLRPRPKKRPRKKTRRITRKRGSLDVPSFDIHSPLSWALPPVDVIQSDKVVVNPLVIKQYVLCGGKRVRVSKRANEKSKEERRRTILEWRRFGVVGVLNHGELHLGEILVAGARPRLQTLLGIDKVLSLHEQTRERERVNAGPRGREDKDDDAPATARI